ncbi:MAG: YidC/Oxa1 family membrane protein insertase [Clostridia bacterium]|nr:YidC/Oxa1 family membrane protein insertase [Clostridia bacterium]
MGNLLNLSTNFIDFTVEKMPSVNLDWIGKIIQWLIEGVGIIGLGIVLFTLILKTIVLPLDIYSRYKMKKQSLLMKAMRPQMEKLQKQYSNDKQMYNQKVMELQKANGISMFGACLPMIVSLVIFMVVFSAFSTYSQYANLQSYRGMEEAYNSSVEQYVLCDLPEDGDLEKVEVEGDGFLIRTTDPAIGTYAYLVDFDAFTEKLYKEQNVFKSVSLDKDVTKEEFPGLKESEKMAVVRDFVREGARIKSADYYRAHRNNFLWVRNIWYPDSPLNKEVPDFSKFSSSISRVAGSGLGATYEESYNEVTYYLRNDGYPNGKLEGNRVNGYFVLIVLAIGLMFLQQFISMRSQKDANELSTVDGSGARTNKWMLIMMPLIYGIFSFFYSAAFSTYMITNTIYSLIMTVVLNKIMDVKFAKKEASGELFKNKKTINNRKRLK